MVRKAPTGQEGAVQCTVFGDEGSDRSGGRCTVKRAPIGQEGAVWWGERRQVKRALYGEEVLYDEEGTIR